MIAITLEQKLTGSKIPLLYIWTEPVLSLKPILPTLNHNPELVGDMHNQVRQLIPARYFKMTAVSCSRYKPPG